MAPDISKHKHCVSSSLAKPKVQGHETEMACCLGSCGSYCKMSTAIRQESVCELQRVFLSFGRPGFPASASC